MNFSESINNLIRSDKPESPTDFIFIILALVLCGLLIYVTQKQTTIPHLDAVLLFLTGIKGVKVADNWQKSKAAAATPEPVQ